MNNKMGPNQSNLPAPGKTPGRHLPRFLLWLMMAPVILVILLASGQLALLLPIDMIGQDTHSKLEANYREWENIVIQPLNPAIVEEIQEEGGLPPGQAVVPGNYWIVETASAQVTPTPTPPATETPIPLAANTLQPPPFSTPFVFIYPSPTSTLIPAFIPLRTSTRTSTPSPTPTNPIPPTDTWTPTATNRPTATRTRTPTRYPTWISTHTATLIMTPTATSTATRTATLTRTPTRTNTATPGIILTWTPTRTRIPTRTATSSATSTPTPTKTSSLSDTATPTPTKTATRKPTPQNIEIPPLRPNNIPNNIACGQSEIVDLGLPLFIDTLVFYEYYEQNPACGDGTWDGICLNWIIIEMGESTDGNWDIIFYWGDEDGTNNGEINERHFPPFTTEEADNEPIPRGELVSGGTSFYSGILIPVRGKYRYIRISAPEVCGDGAQVDALDYILQPPSQ